MREQMNKISNTASHQHPKYQNSLAFRHARQVQVVL